MHFRARFQAGAACLLLLAAGRPAIAEVVVVVSPRSTVMALSKSEVADIFLGKMRRFPNGAAAQPIDQMEGSAARDEFYSTFAGRSHAQLKAYWSKVIFTGRGQPPATAASAAELKRRIAANPAAIGYIDRSQLDSTVRALP